MSDRQFNFRIGLALLWLAFTGSLTVWWMYFALGILSQVEVGSSPHRNMLILEGTTLLVFLLAGGGSLIYFIIQEKKQTLVLRDFFSSYSHEIKTALSSLRLQAESLSEDINDEGARKLLNRLLSDASRVAVSVENSLFVASEGSKPSFLKNSIDWAQLQQELQSAWPHYKINIIANINFTTDKRSLISILQNLIHNSIQHGQSNQTTVQVEPFNQQCRFLVFDDGKGFIGDKNILTIRGVRPSKTSGSGLGLSIVKQLISRLNGVGPSFPEFENGFAVQFDLPNAGGGN